jgi:flagellar hook assembly protein FlgD
VSRAIAAAPAESVTLSGPKYTFLPRQGETYPIPWTVTSEVAAGSSEVLIRIFDLRGQLKRSLYDSRFGSTSPYTDNRATMLWDGRDDLQQMVPAGTYVVHMLVSPKREGGGRQDKQFPVVVATRLER